MIFDELCGAGHTLTLVGLAVAWRSDVSLPYDCHYAGPPCSSSHVFSPQQSKILKCMIWWTGFLSCFSFLTRNWLMSIAYISIYRPFEEHWTHAELDSPFFSRILSVPKSGINLNFEHTQTISQLRLYPHRKSAQRNWSRTERFQTCSIQPSQYISKLHAGGVITRPALGLLLLEMVWYNIQSFSSKPNSCQH